MGDVAVDKTDGFRFTGENMSVRELRVRNAGGGGGGAFFLGATAGDPSSVPDIEAAIFDGSISPDAAATAIAAAIAALAAPCAELSATAGSEDVSNSSNNSAVVTSSGRDSADGDVFGSGGDQFSFKSINGPEGNSGR